MKGRYIFAMIVAFIATLTASSIFIASVSKISRAIDRPKEKANRVFSIKSPIIDISWETGDSGTLYVKDGWATKFVLADAVAPKIDKSNCSKEEELGQQARMFMVDLTTSHVWKHGNNSKLSVSDERGIVSSTRHYVHVVAPIPDTYLVNLTLNGKDISELGVAASHLIRVPQHRIEIDYRPVDWCSIQ